MLGMVETLAQDQRFCQPVAKGAGSVRYAIGIGVQKAATTWLYDILSTHPQIAAAPDKEVDFFSRRHDRGHLWYARQFPARGSLRLDISPSYFNDQDSPARLAAFAPDARLIVMLRDPVARAYSNHLHEVAKGHIPPCSFASAVTQNPAYLDQSRYATHLSRWMAKFGPDRILVLIQEEMLANPHEHLERLCRFLDIDPDHRPAAIMERRNVSDIPRFPALRQGLRAGGRIFRRLGQENALVRLKQVPPVSTLLRLNAQPVRDMVGPLTLADRQMLRAALRDEMARLGPLIGRSRLPWAP